MTTSFWARDSGSHGGTQPLLMKCQNVSVSRWTPRSCSSARRRATVVLPAPGGPVTTTSGTGTGLAGVGAVEVPVAPDLGVPLCAFDGQEREAADRALAAFGVAVEEVDRERAGVADRLQKRGTERILD